MSWDSFVKLHMLELYDLWDTWVPSKENNTIEYNNDKSVMYSHYDEEEDEFYNLVDNGDRVTSFRYFLHFAYENTM